MNVTRCWLAFAVVAALGLSAGQPLSARAGDPPAGVSSPFTLEINPFVDPKSPVTSHNGRLVADITDTGIVEIRDAASNTLLHADALHAPMFTFSPDDRTLAIACRYTSYFRCTQPAAFGS